MIDLADISYSQYLDFQKEAERFDKLSQGEKGDQIDEHIMTMVDCVQPIDGITYQLEGDDIVRFLGEGYQLEGETSVIRLYAHYTVLFRELTKKSSEIDHTYQASYHGHTYYVDSQSKGEKYDCGEVIEAKEFMRELSLLSKDKGDDDGNFEFEYTLKVLSVLFRRKGETLPYHYRDRSKFITERALSFQELKVEVVLNVVSYFNNYYNALSSDPYLFLFFKGKKRAIPTEKHARDMFLKRREEQRIINELVGMKQLYFVAQKEGWYKSFEEMFKSDFSQFCYNMHIYTAMN